jgi:hypothetical protein
MALGVDLSPFFKGSLDEDPGAALQAILRSVLIRTQFLPTVRHIIGWRGLKQSTAAVEGWTAKIKGYSGVFGLFFMGANRRRAGQRSRKLPGQALVARPPAPGLQKRRQENFGRRRAPAAHHPDGFSRFRQNEFPAALTRTIWSTMPG